MSNENEEKLITRDWLAVERTKLANERTFLAYFRTAIVFLASGITIYKLELFSEIKWLGAFLALIAPFILLIGVLRLRSVNQRIRKYYS